MIKFKSKINDIHKFVAIIGLGFLECFYIANILLGIESSFSRVFLSILIISGIYVCTKIIPRKVLIGISIGIPIILARVIYEYWTPIIEYLTQVGTILYNFRYPIDEKGFFIIFILVIIILSIKYLITITLKSYPANLLVSIAIVVIIYFIRENMENSDALFYVIYTTVVLFIFTHWFSIKRKDNNRVDNISSISATILIISIISALFAVNVAKFMPNPLQWIDDLDWFETDQVDEGYSAYTVRADSQSKLTSLVDEFNYNETRMMIVNSPYVNHMRNKTYDEYNSDSWVKSYNEYEMKDSNILFEHIEYIALLDKHFIPYKTYSMKVEMFAESEVIFAPSNSVISTNVDNARKNIYDDIYLDGVIKEGEKYSIEAIYEDHNSQEFIDMIINSDSSNLEDIDRYLDLPRNMSPDIIELSIELTDKYKSNYVKAKIIETYLSQNHTYTLHPPQKPEYIDFVEYFLLETKQGFCTHYASSMAMMLRSIDIPCRYVTGYVLSPPYYEIDATNDEQIYESLEYFEMMEEMRYVEGEDREYVVNKDQSHAWVEVWFDDYGWLAFEPTSSYNSFFATDDLFLQDEDLLVEFDDNFEIIEKADVKYDLLAISIAIIFILGLSSIIIYKKHRYNKKPSIEKIVALWQKIKKHYHQKYKISLINETAREFTKRADLMNEDLQDALHIYEVAMFSNQDILDEYVPRMIAIEKKINKDYKKQKRRNTRRKETKKRS